MTGNKNIQELARPHLALGRLYTLVLAAGTGTLAAWTAIPLDG